MNQAEISTIEIHRWQAVQQRLPLADDPFVFGVSTTGVYCRAGCSSRTPKPEHVRFFNTWRDAEQAGFRPCKRCTPNTLIPAEASQELIIKACQILDTTQPPPSLSELARQIGLSPYHFQRLFKKTIGVTPRQYAAERRLQRLRENIHQQETITTAIYNAGFASSSRFYETSTSSLGMQPRDYRRGGKGLALRYVIAPCYLGWVLIAASEKGICQIDFDDAPEQLLPRLQTRFPQANLAVDDTEFSQEVKLVLKFLADPAQGLALPLDIQGTAFQRRVWQALQGISAGATLSYSQIAAQVGNPQAARAVARACAANQLAVAIPCHRAVQSNGGLGGYRWGSERKRLILQREAQDSADRE